ncbi:MAG: putative toxin-antitoxin system toxin component, PIN family [Bacteroidetes bacterium]|nr:MAG: putative toxin-antitoxin system toxin component, PIN family [Bacteroidota bacterium]
MLIVIDTNVFISAILLPNSLPAKALEIALSKGNLLFSESTKLELFEVIERPKFAKYISSKQKDYVFTRIFEKQILVEPTIKLQACRDTKDNIFLELGLSMNVDCIISGDNDLLVLHPFNGLSIFTPSEFISKFKL